MSASGPAREGLVLGPAEVPVRLEERVLRVPLRQLGLAAQNGATKGVAPDVPSPVRGVDSSSVPCSAAQLQHASLTRWGEEPGQRATRPESWPPTRRTEGVMWGWICVGWPRTPKRVSAPLPLAQKLGWRAAASSTRFTNAALAPR